MGINFGMGNLTTMFNGLARSFSVKKKKRYIGNNGGGREAAEAMANDAEKNELLLRTSGIVNLDRSKNVASVFSKRGEKGVNQDSCVVWEEILSEASHDSDCKTPESDKVLTTFPVWKQSYTRASAAVDHELEHQRKFDSFNNGTTTLTIVRQVSTFSPTFCKNI